MNNAGAGHAADAAEPPGAMMQQRVDQRMLLVSRPPDERPARAVCSARANRRPHAECPGECPPLAPGPGRGCGPVRPKLFPRRADDGSVWPAGPLTGCGPRPAAVEWRRAKHREILRAEKCPVAPGGAIGRRSTSLEPPRSMDIGSIRQGVAGDWLWLDRLLVLPRNQNDRCYVVSSSASLRVRSCQVSITINCKPKNLRLSPISGPAYVPPPLQDTLPRHSDMANVRCSSDCDVRRRYSGCPHDVNSSRPLRAKAAIPELVGNGRLA